MIPIIAWSTHGRSRGLIWTFKLFKLCVREDAVRTYILVF